MNRAVTAQVHLDRRSRLHADGQGGLLVGGQPLRVLRLGADAARVVGTWPGPVDGAALRLARRLHDLGVVVLRAPARHGPADVTVVVPVCDRAADLDRCLTALDTALDTAVVIVVDDGSLDGAAVAAVTATHGARLVRRPVNGGPAVARNTGLALVETPLVAFVDSDCIVPPHWLTDLLPALLDDQVAVVAPRVVGAGGSGRLARYEVGAGPLDLGPEPGPVRPGGRIGHVPAAVLLCRRAALGDGFDEAMRVGEDVDLVWRLAAAGRAVRYDPAVVVLHGTRAGVRQWLLQRHGYGRSAALLDARHPGVVAPAVLGRWAAPTLVALALRRPSIVLTAVAGTTVALRRKLPAGPGRSQEAVRLACEAPARSAVGLAEGAARTWLPLLLLLCPVSSRARQVTIAAVAFRLAATRRTRADLPAVEWAVLRVADDLAYGSGVWRGAIAGRRWRVLTPRLRAAVMAGTTGRTDA